MFEDYSSSNPYFIAEIGVNHEGSKLKAKELIQELSDLGADCAKFQTYKAETLAALDSPAYWDLSHEKTKTQYELFKKLDKFEKSDYEDLSAHCSKYNIDFLSTPFDLKSVELVNNLSKFFKVASADLTNLPLLKAIARKNKPVVMSTGASSLKEIKDSVNILEKYGASEICLLHCVLNYPTPYENAQLGFISILKENFSDLVIGYSDHVKPDQYHSALSLALEFGATVIEKHYTFDKTIPGNDHYHSFDKSDLKSFLNLLNIRQKMKSSIVVDRETEKNAILHARRSLYLARDLPKGSIIVEEDLICLRPGSGISPMKIDSVINKKSVTNLNKNQKLKWEDIE